MSPKPKIPRLTHFLCLPLATPLSIPQLTTTLTHFTQECASSEPCKVTPSASPSSLATANLQHESSVGKQIPEDDGVPTQSSTTPIEANTSSPPRDETSVATTVGKDDPSSSTPLPPKAIRPVGTLHLTLGVTSLLEKERVEAAVAFLKSLDLTSMLAAATPHSLSSSDADVIPVVPPATPLVVKLQGLHAMGKPKQTSSLYASPTDSTDRLMPFAERLRQEFVQAGFALEEKRDLKLHATIVNTLYASKRGKGRKGKVVLRFDAREMMERWKDEVWAEVRLERVAICEMGAKVDESGWERYVEVGGVELS